MVFALRYSRYYRGGWRTSTRHPSNTSFVRRCRDDCLFRHTAGAPLTGLSRRHVIGDTLGRTVDDVTASTDGGTRQARAQRPHLPQEFTIQ